MNKKIINLILGPFLMILCIYFLPNNIFLTLQAKYAVGTVAWIAYWWITTPVAPGVTAFLPIAINAFLPMIDMNLITNNYFSEIIILLFGAGILSLSWEITGLDKKIASRLLMYLGVTNKSQVIFWFLISTVMSSVLPNAIVVATLSPIAIAMLRYIKEEDIANSKLGSLILMSIAWGAGVGGVATPLGGAMNMVTIHYIESLTGTEYMFSDWVIKFIPITLCLTIGTSLFLYFITPKSDKIYGTKEFFKNEYLKLPKMTYIEYICLGLFIVASILSFIRPVFADIFPALKPAYIFLTAGLLTFLLQQKDQKPVVPWKFVEKNMVWDLLFIFAGGLALGELINSTGAAENIGQLLVNLGLNGDIVTVFVIVTLTIILSDITSNTATAAISIPLIISIINSVGLNPIPYIFVASIGVKVSYTLPTSVRAVPVGYGMRPKFMFKYGFLLSLILIPILTLIAYYVIL